MKSRTRLPSDRARYPQRPGPPRRHAPHNIGEDRRVSQWLAQHEACQISGRRNSAACGRSLPACRKRAAAGHGRYLHKIMRRDVIRGRGRIAGLVAFGLIDGSFLPDHLAHVLQRLYASRKIRSDHAAARRTASPSPSARSRPIRRPSPRSKAARSFRMAKRVEPWLSLGLRPRAGCLSGLKGRGGGSAPDVLSCAAFESRAGACSASGQGHLYGNTRCLGRRPGRKVTRPCKPPQGGR